MELGGDALMRSGARCGIRVGILLTAALVACRSEGGVGASATDGGPPETASPTGTVGPTTVWLAGFRVAEDPAALDADTQEFLDLVGGAINVGPLACFDGLPAEFEASSAYVLAVQANSREELERLIDLTGRDPIFVVNVMTMCVD